MHIRSLFRPLWWKFCEFWGSTKSEIFEISAICGEKTTFVEKKIFSQLFLCNMENIPCNFHAHIMNTGWAILFAGFWCRNRNCIVFSSPWGAKYEAVTTCRPKTAKAHNFLGIGGIMFKLSGVSRLLISQKMVKIFFSTNVVFWLNLANFWNFLKKGVDILGKNSTIWPKYRPFLIKFGADFFPEASGT